MSDSSAYLFPSAVGYGLYVLIRGLFSAYRESVDSLNAGQAEREQADGMLTRGFKPEYTRLGWVSLKEPWRMI